MNLEQAKIVAKKRIDEVLNIEPDITETLKIISEKQNSSMFGLEYRVKSKDSLARKIVSDAKEKEISFYEASKQISDVLRYTVLNNENTFTDKYFSFVDELEKNGYIIIRVKNTFKDNVVYKGINTLVKKGDDVFELQFHTPKSIELKEGSLHKIYEKQRILDKVKDKEEYNRLKLEMVDLSNTIPIPKNVERIR